MKRKDGRLNVRRLFVLGAGASFCASLASERSEAKQTPLDSHFCQRIAQLSVTRPVWVEPSSHFVRSQWLDHQEFENFGLEEAVLRQLGHLEFIDAIHPRRRKTSLTSFGYMNQLSHLICFVLRRARENRHQTYRLFSQKVFPPEKAPEGIQDRVITFNYDELLDKHLLSRFDIRQVYFDGLKGSATDRTKHQDKHPHPLLVKLHGSVNWRCPTKDFEGIVRADPSARGTQFVDPIWYSRVGTPAPTDSSSPLIMPPLPVKPITHVSLFRFLWTRAYEYLHEAEEIVICGY